MPSARFSFGDANAQTMEVKYSWWGREEYYLNGKLLHRQWNLSLAGQREFQIAGHTVRVEVSVGPKEYFTRVVLDGQLYIEELFPHIKSQVESSKRLSSHLVPAEAARWPPASSTLAQRLLWQMRPNSALLTDASSLLRCAHGAAKPER
jgi:hypothetical protein